MKKYRCLSLSLSLFIGILLCSSIQAQTTELVWKGFQRYDFTFEQKAARLIVPKQAKAGNPWIWRARFPGWHTEADSILVAEGFHLVYINTDNQFGSPKAVQVWNNFYNHLREQYHLSEKVALMGVSRGGLFVYNWAKQNPDKVACIYAEAPVCDFTSWPGGFGEGEGSPKDWLTLKQEYGFSSDEEAKAYTNNPMDNLAPLAKAKIPILHMIGLEDKIVPPAENTMPLVERYIQLGGIATVVPCTEGKQALQGHHFPIETPRLVADFIHYHTSKHLPLDASNYHHLGRGLKNSLLRFERNKKGRVAFLGGSITQNPGWRDSICVYLQRRFPETTFEFIAAGISSTGSTPGAFRLERDVLSKGPVDLLFEEAAVNDDTNGRTAKEQIKAMEGIVRHTQKQNPSADIVLMHFVDPGKMADYRSGKTPEVIDNHNQVAKHYQLSTINLAKEVTERIDHGEFTWEDDFKNLHPSPFGQVVYANSMIQFLENAFAEPLNANDQLSAHQLPKKLNSFCYDNGMLIDISTIKRLKGWEINPSWSPTDGTGTRRNYTDVPMLISEQVGSSLQMNFTGNAVGIAIAAGQDAGMIEYRIDKGAWQSLNLFTQWSKGLHLPWYYTLSSELSNGKHQLDMRIAAEKDDRSSGHACRIRYFFVNGF